jgi:hypothetical protein
MLARDRVEGSRAPVLTRPASIAACSCWATCNESGIDASRRIANWPFNWIFTDGTGRDPDGNPIYVGDQDLVSDGASEFNDELEPHDGVASATM